MYIWWPSEGQKNLHSDTEGPLKNNEPQRFASALMKTLSFIKASDGSSSGPPLGAPEPVEKPRGAHSIESAGLARVFNPNALV